MTAEALRIIRCDQCHKRMAVPESALGGFGSCLQCGKALRATAANSFPLPPGGDAPPRMTVSHIADPAPASPTHTSTPEQESPPHAPQKATDAPASPHACARCGRLFRGEWDVHETAEGRLCNICARRWRPQEEVHEEKQEKSHQVHQSAEMINPAPMVAETQDPRPWKAVDGFEGHLEQYRFSLGRWMRQHRDTTWFIGIASLVLLLSLLFPVERLINHIFQSTGNIDSVGDSPSWRLLFYSVKYAVDVLEWSLTLLVYLKLIDKLPNVTFSNNLFVITVTAFGLAFMNFFYLNFFIFIIVFFVQMMIVVEVYQLSLSQAMSFSVLLFLATRAGMLLTGFLLGVLGSFL